jgi:hypothetical protein
MGGASLGISARNGERKSGTRQIGTPGDAMTNKDPREALRRIIATYPKAKADPEKLWRIFEAELIDDRELERAVRREMCAQWFPEALKRL